MQDNESRTQARQQGGTRYVFAGTHDRDDDMPTKVCPRCGEVLFADMDVCYGCLYDFAKDGRGRRAVDETATRGADVRRGCVKPPSSKPARSRDPLDAIELDEIDDEVEVGADDDGGGSVSAPRHGRKPDGDADDTIDFGAVYVQAETPAREPSYLVVVRSPRIQVRIPLTQTGLTIGRDASNDIVLHSRAVSREHLRLTPLDGKVLAEDCGATNPARIGDKPLEDSMVLVAGDAVEVCGTTIGIEETTSRNP